MPYQKGRYVKLNIVDYLLIVALSLLVLAILARGVGTVFAKKATACQADIEFVIRDLDEATMHALTAQKAPFCFQDGTVFAEQFTTDIQRMTEIVHDEDGNMQEVESLVSYKVIIALTMKGELARDGTFLWGGTRRLATGETLSLTQGNVTYTADVILVRAQELS